MASKPINFNPKDPSSFVRRLKYQSAAEDWDNKKTLLKALFFISLEHEWIAAKMEEIWNINDEEAEAPTIKELESTLYQIVAAKNCSHLLLDEFEGTKIDDKPVGQVANELTDLFRRAVLEAKDETVDLMVRRQLIKAASEFWQLQLKEAELESVEEVTAKIQVLQAAALSEVSG